MTSVGYQRVSAYFRHHPACYPTPVDSHPTLLWLAIDNIVIRLVHIRNPLKALPTPQFTSLETSFQFPIRIYNMATPTSVTACVLHGAKDIRIVRLPLPRTNPSSHK